MGTPFHFPRHPPAAAAFFPAFGPPVSHQAFHHYNHHRVNFPEIPMPSVNFYAPGTFESDSRLDPLSHHFPSAGHSAVPFPGPELEFGAVPGDEFGLQHGCENGGEKVDDVDLYGRQEDDGVSLTLDMLDRPREGRNLNLALSLGFGQVDEDMDDPNSGMGIGVEGNDVAREVDLELKLGLGSESGREANISEFRGFFGEEPSFPRGLREIGTVSEQIAAFDPQFCPDVIDPMERIDAFDYPPLCYDHLALFNEQHDHLSNLVEDSAFLHDWYGVRGENDVPVHPDLYYGDGINWEMLLAVNLDDPIDGVVEESMNEWRGNPPAAKSAVKALPIIKLSEDELKGKELACTICFAEFSAKERVMQLPCRHYYHGECILPWLELRNTCPVCRFELPTDDPEWGMEE